MIATPPPVPFVVFAEQGVPGRCAGETVTTIEVHRYAASGRSAAARALKALTDTTPGATADAIGGAMPSAASGTARAPVRGEEVDADHGVVLAYVRLKPGRPCVERDRTDSERMLRAQRFIASASVRAIPDGAGRVRIRVDVVQEFPLVVGGRFSGLAVREVRAGTLDLRGEGHMLVTSFAPGGAYRPGFGLESRRPGFLGLPATLDFAAKRAPLGGEVVLGASAPFLANGQRYAWYANIASATEYGPLLRADSGDAAVRLTRATYQVGFLQRIGVYRGARAVGLAGLILVGGASSSADEIVRVTDDGLRSTDDSTLAGRYTKYRESHLAAIGGYRALQFRPVGRFDALRAEQDLAIGFEGTVLAGPRIGATSRPRDLLLGAGVYVGTGDTSDFVSLRARVEARTAPNSGGAWDGAVSAVRLAWYRTPDVRRTRTITLAASALHAMPIPLQLSMRDPDGGLIGYVGSQRAGGRRLTLRVEERWLLTRDGGRFDLAVGAFGDAGRLWAGDVPFGATSPVMASAGFSVLGAYPSGGKRLYRVDIGVPFRRGPGDAAIGIRFSATDRTRTRPEPRDVTRARVETGPATLVRW